MADAGLNTWRGLFRQALRIIDSASSSAGRHLSWSFGGGTVLMIRYGHRVSRDVDIFLDDPQWLGFLSPRLNDYAAALTADYVEQANFLKLTFAEGEIDFIAAPPLTQRPVRRQRIERRIVRVERPGEIIAKKAFHRAASFTARDILDFAVVIERDLRSLDAAKAILRAQRRTVIERMTRHKRALREDFAALHLLDANRTFEQGVAAVTSFLDGLDR